MSEQHGETTDAATSTDPDDRAASDTDATEATPSTLTEPEGGDTAKEAIESDTIQTGAESVVAALEAAGVETLFGVQGGAIMPVYDALYDCDLEHITMAHEQGAAHAADAYGIVTGDPGVCLATSGPGATNLVTGIADASMDSDPMIALTGQVPTDFVGSDAFQETDTTGVTMPVTKDNTFAEDEDAVGADVSTAFALARDGRQGPTLVDLPKDVTQSETDAEPREPSTPETYDPPTTADPEAVETAADTIARAEKPVILAGGGVIKGEASEELRAFARNYGIPVVTTMPGIGSFPEEDDLSLEWAGMHGTGYANLAITHTDVMLAIGTRFDDRLTGGVDSFAPEAEIVHVDIDPAEISKNVHADYPLIGDAAQVIDQLHDALEERSGEAGQPPERYAEWREQCRAWTEEYPMDYRTPDDEPLKPQFVVEAVDEATADDTIVTTGVGQHQMWACQYWRFSEPRTWVSSHGLGTMGYGLPAAIGARFAADDEQSVVCFEGDGSLLMTMQELSVAVRENLDLTVFVLNNEYVGMVRQWQDGFYEGRHMASEYSWCPDFAKLAEAFGASGHTIDDYDEVAETVEAALEYDGPSVVDCHIDPEENVFPMVPSGGENGRFALQEEHLEQLG